MRAKSYIVDNNGNRKYIKSKIIESDNGYIHRIIFDEKVILAKDDILETEIYFFDISDKLKLTIDNKNIDPKLAGRRR